MIGGCVKSDTCKEKLKGKREVYRRSDGRQELRSCIRSRISQAANGVHLAVALLGLTFVSLEWIMLHRSEPSCVDLFFLYCFPLWKVGRGWATVSLVWERWVMVADSLVRWKAKRGDTSTSCAVRRIEVICGLAKKGWRILPWILSFQSRDAACCVLLIQQIP